MGTRDKRIDAYIAKSAEFARPILKHLREVVHQGCPGVEETMKWSFPHFTHQGMLCSMASFKQHCAFGFWRGSLVLGKGTASNEAMGHFGRITSLDDLPPRKTLIGYVRKAATINEAGVKPAAKPKRAAKAPVAVPADLAAGLAKNAKARKTFQGFSPSHRREYVEWIAGAKREETRRKRLATAVAWMAEGRTQNWRYEK